MLLDGGDIEARAVIVATGVSYRTPGGRGPAGPSSGVGSTTAPPPSEAAQCEGDDVYIVGAANSAGQAALTSRASPAGRAGRPRQRVEDDHVVVPGRAHPRAPTKSRCAAHRGRGRHRSDHLEPLTARRPRHRREIEMEASWLFVFIGASPRTDWLGTGRPRRTRLRPHGPDLTAWGRDAAWPRPGAPCPGDEPARGVRRRRRPTGSMERVASAVGEGAMSVSSSTATWPRSDAGTKSASRDDLGRRARATISSVTSLTAGDRVAVRGGATCCSARASPPTPVDPLGGHARAECALGREDVVLRTMERPGHWAGGFGPGVRRRGRLPPGGRACEPGRLLRLPPDVLRGLPTRGSPWQATSSTASTRRPATSRPWPASASAGALGTLAAGLAHEINDPAAAAATRAADGLRRSARRSTRSLRRLAGSVTPSSSRRSTRSASGARAADGGLRSRSSGRPRGELADWLSRHGVEPHGGSRRLAAAGVGVTWCDRAAAEVAPERSGPRCAGSRARIRATTLPVRGAASQPVACPSSSRAIKSYSQMDRGSRAERRRARGAREHARDARRAAGWGRVERDFGRRPPAHRRLRGELDQVWTDLIDNAVDAMDGEAPFGCPRALAATRVVVEVTERRGGCRRKSSTRAFEAFFTTKDVGKGTGLGLDIARRIVVDRHGGVTSRLQPGPHRAPRVPVYLLMTRARPLDRFSSRLYQPRSRHSGRCGRCHCRASRRHRARGRTTCRRHRRRRPGS